MDNMGGRRMNTGRGYHKRPFTLIELLVVAGLSALILGLGIPAFGRMMQGNRVEECSRSIKLGLEQAQLRAASERKYVAVILPNGNDSKVSEALHTSRLGGYRLAYVKKDKAGDGGYKFDKWADSDWRNAPSGAMLLKIDDSSFGSGSVTNCPTKTTADFAGASNLQEVDGVKDDNGNSLQTGDRNAIVFTPYGNTVGDNKLYLLISETAVNGGDIAYPSTGKSGETINYLVLRVNNLTGRVEYYKE